MKTRACLTAMAIVLSAAPRLSAEALTVEEVVTRYTEARGGTEIWRDVPSLWLEGIYATFSDHEPFTMARAQGDRYRIDFKVLGGEAVRARDAEGPWWRHPLLQPEAARLTEGPYKPMVERESHFAPLLVDAAAKGVAVELIGPGEVDGIPVIELAVRLPSGAEERWYLDGETYREVAVDSQVNDYTQSAEPMRQRAFFDDFREVEGLVLPYRIDYEFGHRLESMTVRTVELDRQLPEGYFSPPPSAAAEETEE